VTTTVATAAVTSWGSPRARRGVGQVDAAGLRARDARPLRLRPPAVRGRARRARRHPDRGVDR
jgi:hypothetical protein